MTLTWLRQAVPHTILISTETVEEILSAPDFESALKIAWRAITANSSLKQNPEEIISGR